jgi:hypothetical protein
MERTYFVHFCELLNHNTPLDTYTANSFYYKLKFEIIPDLKSEISKSLISIQSDKTQIYLDYLLTEIERQDYVKEANIGYIQKHLDHYKVKLQDILDFKLFETNRDFYFKVIDIHYKSLQPFSAEKDEAFRVQYDFVNYFSKICADEIIDFINTKKRELAPVIIKQETTNNEPFKRVYLDYFCKELSNDNLITHNSFIHIFNLGILHLVPYLQDEIRENLLALNPIKQNLYVEYLKNQLRNTPFFETSENSINHYLTDFKCNKEDFPEFNKGELYKQLNRFAYWQLLGEKEHYFLVELQYDFFYYASMLEAKKMIAFIDELINPNLIIPQPLLQSNKNITTDLNPIFLDLNGKILYDRIIDHFELLKDTRSQQAKFMAIWESKSVRETIFKSFKQKADFINFLNSEYQLDYNSRSTSKGNNFIFDVENCLKLHIEELNN